MEQSRVPRTVLVYHDGSSSADGVVRSACNLVESGGRVSVLAVTCVPRSLPLQNLPAQVDDKAQKALRQARDAARGVSGRDIETQIRRGREAARLIVMEARRIDADAIFLTLDRPRFSWATPRLTRTACDVLRHAPCPVFLGYFPQGELLDASHALAEAEDVLRHAS